MSRHRLPRGWARRNGVITRLPTNRLVLARYRHPTHGNAWWARHPTVPVLERHNQSHEKMATLVMTQRRQSQPIERQPIPRPAG
jgi:hypothetical protein